VHILCPAMLEPRESQLTGVTAFEALPSFPPYPHLYIFMLGQGEWAPLKEVESVRCEAGYFR
jgi:hypothetical protein